jgi:hypothetical protein
MKVSAKKRKEVCTVYTQTSGDKINRKKKDSIKHYLSPKCFVALLKGV